MDNDIHLEKGEDFLYIVNDFFQEDGRSLQSVIETYILNIAPNLLAQHG